MAARLPARSVNFTAKEEAILLCLVRKYKSVIENKKTDYNINKSKSQCWKQIETEFNAKSGETFRTSLTLKNKYENLKKRTKKKLADEKCYALGTGGAPAKKPPEITDIDMEIKEILAERIDGLPSQYGGDSSEVITIINECDNDWICDWIDMQGETNVGETQKEMNMDETQDETNIDDTQDETNIDKIQDETNVGEMQHEMNNLLNNEIGSDGSSNKRKRNEYDAMCSKVSHWAASKANLESEKIRFAEEEQIKKLEIMEQKCRVECELMRKESEAKIKKLEQEAEVTIEGITECNRLRKDILLLEKHVMMQKLKNISKHDN